MSVRALSTSGDWTFGIGANNYLSKNAEVAQNIQTRLSLQKGECFFALDQGVDWTNLIGSKSQAAITLAVMGTILNTPNVTGLLPVSLNINSNRQISLSYNAQTVYSISLNGEFTYISGV